jgi:NAD(P)-dependent dehydrogenase (short-subunit alcohol dehydrogenase family)
MNTRVAIVTGAGGALGRATSKALAGSGFTVVAVDRKEQTLRELPDGIRLEVADATDPAVPRPLVDRIAGMVGPPEVLVNTIGAFEVGGALAATPETLSRMLDVNLGAALWLSQAVAPHMQQLGSGAIVHVAAHRRRSPASSHS